MCLGLKTSTKYLKQQEQMIRTKFAHVRQKSARLEYEEKDASYALLDHVLHLRHVQLWEQQSDFFIVVMGESIVCFINIYNDVSYGVCSI